MPVYTESLAYARERLARLESRYQYSYQRDYYITRAANSSTRRMSNINKLRSWATVLADAGLSNASTYATNRADGLSSGAIPTPTRRRLGRTQVPRYEHVPALNPDAEGPYYVEYEFTITGEDV